MKHQPVSYLFLATVVLAMSLPATAGEFTRGERDQEEGGGTSPAIYHLDQDKVTFEATIDDERDNNGLKLVDVEVLLAGSTPMFSGVFHPVTGTIHELINGTQFEWDTFITTVEALNGRWLDIEVISQTGADRWYSAIYLEDGDDYDHAIDSDMTDAALQANMESYIHLGYQVIDFEAYTIPSTGETRFAAIWTREPNQPMTHLYYDLAINELADLATPLAGRIIDFERYESSFYLGQERFALLVANHPGGEWHLDTYMSETQLDSINPNESDTDTHLIDLHVFRDGPDLRYSGVWGENWKSLNELAAMPAETIVTHNSVLSTLIGNFEGLAPNGARVGLYAKNLRTGQSVSYRKDEPIYLGSATKTAAHIRLWQQIEDNHFTNGENEMLPYTDAPDSGAPWYMDERPRPGFSTGTPKYSYCNGGTNDGKSCPLTCSGGDNDKADCTTNSDCPGGGVCLNCPGGTCEVENNLGQSFAIDQFDRAMMRNSDNAATSALIDHPDHGLAYDTTNLNEWLSAVPGVGQGWGIVTSIQDIDRLMLWQGQHTAALRDNPSYFLAPGHTMRPRLWNSFKACTTNSGNDEPATCPTPQDCDRCDTDDDCSSGESCVALEDPWGDLRAFFGLTTSDSLPACSNLGCGGNDDELAWTEARHRYFNTGINSATPRAFSNLLEKFWSGDFLTTKQADAMGNMLAGNALNDAICRTDDGTCDGDGYTMGAVKGGARGGTSDDTQVCTETALIQMNGSLETFTLIWFTEEGSLSCGTLRDQWAPLFSRDMLQHIAVDLVADGGSFTPTMLGANDELRIDAQVDNAGGGIGMPFDVSIYASTDITIDSGDTFLGTIRFGGPGSWGGTGVANYPIQLANELSPGSYYIGMIVDTQGGGFGEVPELDETTVSNNGRLSLQPVTILPPCEDNDSDGYYDCHPGCDSYALNCGDCDDTNALRNPGEIEICDGIDNDCDLSIDNVPTPLVAKRIVHDDPLPLDNFGQALANLGDLNGDTIDDFAIAMPGKTIPGIIDSGGVRVISGADLSTICDAFLPTPTNYDMLGESVAAAGGDLNANGDPDFVVGIPNYDGVDTNTGGVAVFNGPDCAFIRMMIDPVGVASDNLGHAVVSIGDVDNDTVPDIASTAFYSDLGAANHGAVLLFSGATGTKLFTMYDATGVADDLGDSLAGPGDLTGDGIPDIAAGAPETNVTSGSNGAIYIFSGFDGTYQYRLTDPTGETSARLGTSLTSLGDLGGDGKSELAAGQMGDIVNGDRTGSIAVFNSFTNTVLLHLVNPIGVGASSERFPTSIAPIPDVNGDGITDVVVGAEGDDDLAADAGSVFVFDSVTGFVLHHVFDPAGVATNKLGTDVIGLGDISGDGIPDFVASAPEADNIEGNEAGHVVVFAIEEDCDNDGYTPYGGDCDDMDSAIRPDRNEICDMVDNDCDGQTDEDQDGDGFDVCVDCNDLRPLVNPNGIEICNGADDDCDGFTDAQPSLPDLDGDNLWGPCSDCDNTNPNINSQAPDTCNHIDDDCDGIPDQGFPMVVSTRFSMLPSGMDNDEWATDVASIGDVNNDGIDDFVAGAPLADIGGSSRGAAAVFDGATGALVCVATPETVNYSQAGWAVAGVGDVTGDGAGDFVMGSPFHDDSFSDQGKVYVINGDDCTLIRELIDSSAQVSDRLGESVAGIGDLTGDGIGEIAAGAPRALTPYGNDGGAVLVWNGATGAELFKLIDPHGGSNRVGTSVAGVDDVNADGVADIVAGAPFDDGLKGGDVGSVLIFSGFDGSIIHKVFDPNGTGSDQLGTSVAGIADLTGDFVPDILAGAPREDTGGGDNGAILVLSGADGTVAQIVPLTDVATSHQFGVSVAALQDLNGDLIPEFAGGSVNDDTEGSNTGRVLIINGADFSVLHDLTVPGSSSDSNLGQALDGIGDLNGDGTPEMIVAQPRQHTQEDTDVGRVIVFSFESDCDSDGVGPFEEDCDDQSGLRYPGLIEFCDGIDNDCDLSIDEDEDGDGDDACADCVPDDPTISTSMTEVCNMVDDDCNMQIDEGVDLDGDTYTTPCDCDDDDANVNGSIVEVCNTIDDNCDGQVDEGFGMPLDQVRILDPEPNVADDVGHSIAIIGDVDLDSAQDFVIGVPGEDTGANGGGSATVVSGATRNVICRLVDPNVMTSDAMGDAVAGVGDVTGDGTPDIAVGTPHDDWAGASSGAVQIFDGATCAWVRELTDPGGEAADLFGTSIASIGDVTGDMVPDIAVGSNDDHENGYGDVGSVSVFNGATGVFLYKALDPHGRDNDQLGISVSALGDVDFDGIPDFAAGALADVALGTTPGSVSLFSGIDGSWIRSIIDTTLGANGYLGRSVAAAGDMNGDGVPDLISGAEGDDTGATNSGAVLAFSGLDGSLIRRFVDSSPLQSADLGAAVAAAGDLNGDGITEVVAGGPDSSRSGSSAGEVVLFDGATGAVLHRFTDASSMAGDDLGAAIAVADITGGGGVEILAGAPNGDPGGLNSAGYVTVFTLDADCDGDGYSPLADCDDTNGGTTGAPGAAQSLLFSDKTTMSWTAPADPGLSPGTLVYDVVRSGDPSDFTTATTCVETDDGGDTTATDTGTPGSGGLYAYLVRVETQCGAAADPDRSIAQCP